MYPQQQQTSQPPMNYNQMLGSQLYTKDYEKTFIDKVLDRADSERLRELMKKGHLERSELLELLYLIIGINTKLVNFTDWDRYLLGKDLAWIRDFVTKIETLIDYMETIEDGQMGDITKDGQIYRILKQIQKHDEHNIKFMVDIYLYLCNSTLSVSGVAFDTLTKSKFEYAYPAQGQYMPQQPKQSVVSRVFGGRK